MVDPARPTPVDPVRPVVVDPARPTPVTPARPVVIDPVRPVVIDPVRLASGTVEVSVFRRTAATGGVAVRETPLAGATLITTNLANNQATEQPLAAATLTETLRPGKYRFIATAGTGRSSAVEIELLAGETEKVRLVVP